MGRKEGRKERRKEERRKEGRRLEMQKDWWGNTHFLEVLDVRGMIRQFKEAGIHHSRKKKQLMYLKNNMKLISEMRN